MSGEQQQNGMPTHPLTLCGAGVELRPLSLELVPALAEAALPGSVTRWFPQPLRTLEEVRAFVALALAEQAAGRMLPFVTIDRASGRVAGSTRFAAIDRVHRHVEIGWTFLGQAWQRSGLNTEAKLLMLGHAFEAWGCLRVEFKTDRLNQQSQDALERLGAVREGVFRNHVVCADGRIRDSVWYSVTDGEWPGLRARLRRRLARDSSPENNSLSC
jgi:RimJ/RimL family protein N-acetyltransferase